MIVWQQVAAFLKAISSSKLQIMFFCFMTLYNLPVLNHFYTLGPSDEKYE